MNSGSRLLSRWHRPCGLALLAWIGLGVPARGQYSVVPENPLNQQMRGQEEVKAVRRILELTDIQGVLSQRHLLPPTVVIQRDIVPAISDPSRGRAVRLKRGQSLPLHDADQRGAILPVEVRPAINSIPLRQQGRFDPLAIRKLARGLQPGFGLIPLDATDLVYQLREHLSLPATVMLTEYAPATLQRKGSDVGDIELAKHRELPLLEVQGNALRLQVYNSEVEVPVEWTDYHKRQRELNFLLDLLRPVPTVAALAQEPLMSAPEDTAAGSPMDTGFGAGFAYEQEQIADLQIQALEQARSLQLRMLDDKRRLQNIHARLRLLTLQIQKHDQIDNLATQGNPAPPSPIPRDRQRLLLVKQYRQAFLSLAGAYQDAAATRLEARRGFEARALLDRAREQIQRQSEDPTLVALGLEQLASMEARLTRHDNAFAWRKSELGDLARRDPVLGQSAFEAIQRDYADMPAEELRLLQRRLDDADWERARTGLLDQIRPALKIGRTDEAVALALLDQIKEQLPRDPPGHYQRMRREIQYARRKIRGYHVDKPLAASEEVPDTGLLSVLVMGAEPKEDTLWLRIYLLGGLGLSVALIAGALVFVLRPRARATPPDTPRPGGPA